MRLIRGLVWNNEYSVSVPRSRECPDNLALEKCYGFLKFGHGLFNTHIYFLRIVRRFKPLLSVLLPRRGDISGWPAVSLRVKPTLLTSFRTLSPLDLLRLTSGS